MSTETNVLDVLVRARATIDTREKWCRVHYENTPEFNWRRPFASRPVQHCAIGAMKQATGQDHWCGAGRHLAYQVLEEVINYYFGDLEIPYLNDTYAHQEFYEDFCVLHDGYENIMFAYDKAIAGVRAVICAREVKTGEPEVELALV